MVPFAGYEMPVQYDGVMAEHLWTRTKAGLFDVSHMGQLLLSGEGVDEALEALIPADLRTLKPGGVRYSLLLDEGGGILDDLMVTRWESGLYLVVNGATKWDDIAHLREHLPDAVTLNHLDDAALLALQGPEAVTALEPAGARRGRAHLSCGRARFVWKGVDLWISRSGYTGEDGFEISVPATAVEGIADALLAEAEVKPIGLGARDSLRLEAGLPLYGHDLTDDTTPVAADLTFAISKRRREEGGFLGAERILAELANGSVQRRVGLTVEGRQPVREGAAVLDDEGSTVGQVTSGGFAPSVEGPIAMAYVPLAPRRARHAGHAHPARQAAPRHRHPHALRPPPLPPEGHPMRRFTKEHEWIELTGDTARCGITAYAQEQLGDVVFAEVPAAGTAS